MMPNAALPSATFALLLQGIILGVAIAAPVGPIGLLCIRRTLHAGWWAGVAAGLGAATADAVYGGLAVSGLSIITSTLIGVQAWLQFGGGLFLLWLGLSTLRAAPAPLTSASLTAERRPSLGRTYLTTFLLTLTNPATILAFAAIFAGLGTATGTSGWLLVCGVFIGSALWWVLLSSLTAGVRTRLPAHWLIWVQRGSGIIIGGFGILALLSVLIGT